ncbi:MAG: M56 family metallopeptidase [Planctomycetota bacterium]
MGGTLLQDTLAATTRAWAADWWQAAGQALLNGSLALVVLLALWWPLRRRLSPCFVSALFLLPLLKLALPIEVAVPEVLASLSLDGWLAAPPPVPPAAWELVTLVEAADAPPPPAPSFGWREGMFVAWILGAGFLALRFVLAQVRTRRLVRAATPIDAAAFPLDLDALRRRAGVRRQVRWRTSAEVATPAAGGLLRPTILLPAGFAASMPDRQLAFVLLHELAHVRRHDIVVATLQRLVQIVWFFHPAVWLASWIIDQHRELACDQDALARSGASRRECGEAFLSVAAWIRRASMPAPALVTFDATRALKRRLMQILQQSPSRPSRFLTAAYFALAAAVTLPSAKAAANAEVDLDSLVLAPQQDEGQREQIEQLRRALTELKKQHAELSKKLQAMQKTQGKAEKAKAEKAKAEKAKAGRRDEEDDDDDDDEEHEHAGGARAKGGTWFMPGMKGAQVFRLGGKDQPFEGAWAVKVMGGDDDGDDGEGGDGKRHRVFFAGPDGLPTRGFTFRVDDDEHEGEHEEEGEEPRAHVWVMRGNAIVEHEHEDDDGDEEHAKAIVVRRVKGDAAGKSGKAAGKASKTKRLRLRNSDGDVDVEVPMPDEREIRAKVMKALAGKLPATFDLQQGEWVQSGDAKAKVEVKDLRLLEGGDVRVLREGDGDERMRIEVKFEGDEAGSTEPKVKLLRLRGHDEDDGEGEENEHREVQKKLEKTLEKTFEKKVDVRLQAPKTVTVRKKVIDIV